MSPHSVGDVALSTPGSIVNFTCLTGGFYADDTKWKTVSCDGLTGLWESTESDRRTDWECISKFIVMIHGCRCSHAPKVSKGF